MNHKKFKKQQPQILSLLKSVGFQTAPKSQLPEFIKFNKSAIGSVYSPKEKQWCTLLQSSPKFIKFFDKISDIYSFKMPMITPEHGFPFFEVDIIVDYSLESVDRHYTCPEHFIMHESEDFQLWLLPWEDGVMIERLNVSKNKRGTGIGTKVMNLLYDISEEIDCPLYLIPFPDDNFKTSELFNEVNRLKDWYSKLDFGPIDEKGVIWSNY